MQGNTYYNIHNFFYINITSVISFSIDSALLNPLTRITRPINIFNPQKNNYALLTLFLPITFTFIKRPLEYT